MSDNVVSFAEFEDELQISHGQSEIPRVVLEGGDDVVLFRRWFFDRLDRMEFIQAANVGAGAGCTAVPEAVRRLLDQGVKAYGLSDRDKLFRTGEWATLFLIDDAAFAQATEDDHGAINYLWEIEAYVIDPAILPSWVRAHHRNAPANDADCNASVERAVAECETLLKAQVWLATAHRCGKRIAPGTFCNRPADEFEAEWTGGLAQLEDAHGTAAEVGAHVGAILDAAPAAPAERLRWLLRYVDTKRLILRLQHRLSLSNARHKWLLVEFMALKGIRPQELDERLSAIEARFGT